MKRIGKNGKKLKKNRIENEMKVHLGNGRKVFLPFGNKIPIRKWM